VGKLLDRNLSKDKTEKGGHIYEYKKDVCHAYYIERVRGDYRNGWR